MKPKYFPVIDDQFYFLNKNVNELRNVTDFLITPEKNEIALLCLKVL